MREKIGGLVEIPDHEQPRRPEEDGSGGLDDLDPVLQERLNKFPDYIREGLASISPETYDLLLESRAVQESVSAGLHKGAQSEYARIIEKERTQDRHSQGIYSEKEFEGKDSISRELITLISINKFVARIENKIHQDPQEATKAMDHLWSNRGKENKDIKYYDEYFSESEQAEHQALKSEQKKISEEIKRLESKSSLSRPSRKKLQGLKSLWGETWVTGWGGEKIGRLQELDQKLKSKENKETLENNLSLYAKYFDGAEFSFLFNEAISFRFRWLKKIDAGKADELLTAIQDWFDRHQDDPAIKEIQEKDIATNEKRQKLAEHFWRLFDSYEFMQDKQEEDSNDTPRQNTLAELNVVISLLKRE